MAGLATHPETTTNQIAIPRERDQLRALLEMRWSIFVRNMRRDEAKVGFVLWLTGRILVFGFAIGIGALCCLMAYLACRGHLLLSHILFWVMLVWQALGVLRSTAPTGVESELLRFPMRMRTYVLLWLSAGALESITLAGAWACLGLFIGLVLGHAGIVRPLLACALFFALNIFIVRNVLLWLSRLLERRRTRELTLIFFSLMGILPRLGRHLWQRASELIHRIPLPPVLYSTLHFSPPALAAHAAQGSYAPWIGLAGLTLWTAALAATAILGLRRSFRGELVQEFAAAAEPKRLTQRAIHTGRSSEHPAWLVAQMEWSRVRHGGTAFFAIFSPLIYVFLFGARLAHGSFGFWALPLVSMYLGLNLRAYNIFGADGPGVQTLLLAPVPLRSAILGKNLFAALLFLGQLAAAAILIAVMARGILIAALLFTLLWVACQMSVAFGIGNRRSLTAPMRADDPRAALAAARANRANRQGGGWIALAAIFATSLAGGGILAACLLWLHRPWIAPLAMLPFTMAAVLWYRRSLADPRLQGDIAYTERLTLNVARTA